jgi:hypothetical protein
MWLAQFPPLSLFIVGSILVYGVSVYRNLFLNRFAWHFSNTGKLTDKDLENWASCISTEISISREKEELKAVEELKVILSENIKYSSKHTVIIEKLITKIESQMKLRKF